MNWVAIGIIVLAVLIILPMAVKIVPEYERGAYNSANGGQNCS